MDTRQRQRRPGGGKLEDRIETVEHPQTASGTLDPIAGFRTGPEHFEQNDGIFGRGHA
ncbi:hypothetical protein [Methylobacterium haplocladii]|nr:hypothetical protein [Methylobacterium haplocladii]GJD83723.1 hypothetical protein HPGCJGGD_1593 [Methylobacterium haplocladii]